MKIFANLSKRRPRSAIIPKKSSIRSRKSHKLLGKKYGYTGFASQPIIKKEIILAEGKAIKKLVKIPSEKKVT